MNAMDVFKRLKDWGPLLFAVGFIAPLIAQSLDRMDFTTATESTHLTLALGLAIPLGLLGKMRGRWI